MNRREALSGISLIAGGSLVLPQVLLTGCERAPHPFELFTWGDTEILDEIAEVIYPETEGVPGAKAAKVGEFIQSYVSTCLKQEHQRAFLTGYSNFKTQMQELYNSSFDEIESSDRIAVIEKLENEKSEPIVLENGDKVPHFYSILKNVASFGYFTSEIGATKALRYLPIPGSQKGEIAYNGEKSWAL